MSSRPVQAALGCLIVIATVLPPASRSFAEPIFKPKKYHGPIPKHSLTLTIGFLGGPGNDELWDYLGGLVPGNVQLRSELETNDFGSSPTIDLVYTHKVHPNFAFRMRGGVAFMTSDQSGLLTGTEIDTTTGQVPLYRFERNFNTTLLSLAASGIYYFQDASVSEYQVYTGLGLGLVFPYQSWEQILTETEPPFAEVGTTKVGEWSAEPEFHLLLGVLYHIRTTVALHAEARYQMAESKVKLNLPTESDGFQDLVFVVDYSGFILGVGVSKFF